MKVRTANDNEKLPSFEGETFASREDIWWVSTDLPNREKPPMVENVASLPEPDEAVAEAKP